MHKIKEHGKWETYQREMIPADIPDELAPRIIWVRRVGDHRDWYEYLRDKTSFESDTVKMTVYDMPGGYRQVQAVNRDATMLCPQGSTVLEVWGIEDADPQETYGYGKLQYMPDNQSFEPMVFPPVPDFAAEIAELRRRIEKLESGGK